jgi:phage portal protein BeeE
MRLPSWLQRDAGTPSPSITVSDWAEFVNYANHAYPLGGYTPTVKGSVEIPDIQGDFAGFARGAFKENAVVFACMRARSALFCEARFKYRQLRSGRPGDLFGDQSLAILERPWPNGTTGDLLARMEQDASLAGNFYARVISRPSPMLQRMRPDWVYILLGSEMDADDANAQLDATILGYAYYPGGPKTPNVEPVLLNVNEVVHYAPTPDPLANFRGMSWLTSVVRDIQGDKGYNEHKLKFLENGAVTNLFMVMDKDVLPENAKIFEERFREKNEGRYAQNRWKTLFVGGGATPMPVGSNFQEMDFRATQGAGETRIAAAAGTPPAVVGLSEGLQGSSLNSGNFDAAMRLFADITIRELWRKTAGALAISVPVPTGAELWYDDRDIPALKEDIKKAGERLLSDVQALSALFMAGADWDAAVDAVTSGDLARLKGKHSGLQSVQTQPGTPATNGASNGAVPAPV